MSLWTIEMFAPSKYGQKCSLFYTASHRFLYLPRDRPISYNRVHSVLHTQYWQLELYNCASLVDSVEPYHRVLQTNIHTWHTMKFVINVRTEQNRTIHLLTWSEYNTNYLTFKMRYIFILVLVLRRTYMRDVVWQWLAQQTRNLSGESSITIKDVVSLSKKLYIHCAVLVGFRNKFERDFHKQNNCSLHNRTILQSTSIQ